MKRPSFKLLATLTFLALPAFGCSQEFEGQRCSRKTDLTNPDADCEVGLECRPRELTATSTEICCKPTGSTNPACQPGGGTTTTTSSSSSGSASSTSSASSASSTSGAGGAGGAGGASSTTGAGGAGGGK